MRLIEQLQSICYTHNITIHYDLLPYDYTGMLVQLVNTPSIIVINSSLSEAEQTVVLAEHLGYYFAGRNMDPQTRRASKNYLKECAKTWSYNQLLPLSKFIEAMERGVNNRKQLAAFCQLPENYILEAVAYYKSKYGDYVKQGCHAIFFEPLGILRFF